jgi:hypothetical protein
MDQSNCGSRSDRLVLTHTGHFALMGAGRELPSPTLLIEMDPVADSAVRLHEHGSDAVLHVLRNGSLTQVLRPTDRPSGSRPKPSVTNGSDADPRARPFDRGLEFYGTSAEVQRTDPKPMRHRGTRPWRGPGSCPLRCGRALGPVRPTGCTNVAAGEDRIVPAQSHLSRPHSGSIDGSSHWPYCR